MRWTMPQSLHQVWNSSDISTMFSTGQLEELLRRASNPCIFKPTSPCLSLRAYFEAAILIAGDSLNWNFVGMQSIFSGH